jgi:osmotically-inducible protein OsmY
MINNKFAKKPLVRALLSLMICGTPGIVSAETQTSTQTETVEYSATTTTPSAPKPATVVVTDADIKEQFSYIINSHKELLDDVTFDVRGSVITLKGKVDNASERELTARLAREIVGVARVENLLRSKK